MKQFFGFLLILIFLLSCKEEESISVDQDRIYAKYWISATEGETTSAFAKFNFGNSLGTPLKLSEGSDVYFNDQRLDFNDALNLYSIHDLGVLSGTFRFVDLNGDSFINEISLNTISLDPNISVIDLDTTFVYSWVGLPLQEDETIELRLTAENSESTTVSTNEVNATSIIIDPSMLSKYQDLDELKIRLIRRYKPQLMERSGAGGNLSSRYESLSKELLIDN
jgi:hypothetical protein